MVSVRFHFLFWTAMTVSAKEPLYGKIDDKVVLTPGSGLNPITSIEWKHGADLAIDWYGDEPTAYRHFKVRGSLNISTGELTITGLTPDDSGKYTVEINNKVTSKTELLVISPVSKPNISKWCEPKMTYCVLTCNGDTTGAEPVTYKWTSGDTTLSSSKEHNITEENKEPWFSCAFENPVSNISSEEVSNPFIIRSDRTWIYILIPVIIVILVVGIFFLIYKCRQGGDYSLISGKAADGTREAAEMSDFQNPSTQDPTSVVTQNTSNGTVKSNISDHLEPAESPDTSNETKRPAGPGSVEETSNQDTTSTGPPETSKEPEESTTSPDVTETSTQDLETAESSDPSNETETTEMPPPVQNTSTQEPTPVVVQDPSNETVNSTIPEVHKTSTQDLKTAESPDTSNETERPASPGSVQETSNQDTTSTGSPETSKEPEGSATSPDVTETSTQQKETAESSDPSNETETTEMPPPVQNTSIQEPTSVVVQDPSNETERPAGPGSVEETRC